LKKWNPLNHTSDYAFRVYGRTVKDLFINSVFALVESIFGNFKISDDQSTSINKAVNIESLDQETLIIDWLRNILELILFDNLIPINIVQLEIYSQNLSAQLKLTKIPVDTSYNIDIKAITYHDVKIVLTEGLYQVDIVCDI